MSKHYEKSNLRCCYRFLELFNRHKTFFSKVDTKVTKYCPPNTGSNCRYKYYTKYKFSNSPSFRDTCYKYSNERCPCNEPCPVKQSPASEPTIVTIRINLKCSWNKITDILTHTIYKCIQSLYFWSHYKAYCQKSDCNIKVCIRNNLNSFIQPGYCGSNIKK